jgi:hypothetical protein
VARTGLSGVFGGTGATSRPARSPSIADSIMHDYWRGGACEHPAIISFIGKNTTQWGVRAQEARRLKERGGAPSDQNQLNKHGWGSMHACPAGTGSSWCQAGNMATSHSSMLSTSTTSPHLPPLSLSPSLSPCENLHHPPTLQIM